MHPNSNVNVLFVTDAISTVTDSIIERLSSNSCFYGIQYETKQYGCQVKGIHSVKRVSNE